MYARALFVFLCCCALALATASSVRAAPADDQYTVAAGHYSRARWELAAEEFEQFLADYGGDARAPAVHFYLAEALLQSQKFAEAAPHYAAVRESSADADLAGRALFRLGEIAYLAGNDEEALAQLNEFHADRPDDELNAYALPYLADMQLRAGAAEQAVAHYRAALAQYPQGPLEARCRYGLARALESLGDEEEAAQRYQDLAESSQYAPEALLHLGRAQYQRQEYRESLETLTRFGEQFPEHAARGEARYWQAMSHWQLDEYQQAVAILEAALAAEPQHELAPAMHYYAAEGRRIAEEFDPAVAHYEAVLANAPESEWAEASLVACMEIALAGEDYARVAELSQRHKQTFPAGEKASAVARLQAAALVRQEEYVAAAEILTDLVAAGAFDAADATAQSEQAKSRYLLALAQLGAKEWQAALTTLDGITAPADDAGELAAGIPAARATALYELGRYQEAIPQFEAQLASGTASPRGRAQLAVAQARLGQWQAAQDALSPLAEDSRAAERELYLSTLQVLAQEALRGEATEWAVTWNQALVDSGHETFAAAGQRGLAWAQLSGQEEQASISSFETYLRGNPPDPQASEALLTLGGLYEREGRGEKALACYRRLWSEHAAAPQAPAALFAAARIYDETDRDPQAAELLEQLVGEHPEFTKTDAALYRWAWVLDDLGQKEEADAQFERLYREHPQSTYWGDACYRLAQRAARARDNERAEQLASELIAHAPQGELALHALYLRGQVAANRADWPAVARDMQELLNSHGDSPLALPARYWLGEALYHQEKYDEAAEAYAQVAAATAGRGEPWLAIVALRQMQLAALEKNWQEVERLSADLAERFPGFSQAYEADYLLGRSLASQGRLNEAREAYARVTKSTAANGSETAAMAQWMIGETYFHQRQYDEAIRAYHRVELLYDYPQWKAAALLQAGKCHEAQGQWSQAMELYEGLAAETESNQFIEEARQRLQIIRERASRPTP